MASSQAGLTVVGHAAFVALDPEHGDAHPSRGRETDARLSPVLAAGL
jgi:hypothetical protein